MSGIRAFILIGARKLTGPVRFAGMWTDFADLDISCMHRSLKGVPPRAYGRAMVRVSHQRV